jgi:hypothetical protein
MDLWGRNVQAGNGVETERVGGASFMQQGAPALQEAICCGFLD